MTKSTYWKNGEPREMADVRFYRYVSEDDLFRNWLNCIDAIVTYDERRYLSVSDWRQLYDDGLSYQEAIECGLGIGFLS